MKSRNSKRNVQQHFVTASYLAGFTLDGRRDSQLYVYERNSDRTFRTVPDKVAKRRNYYSVPKRDGGTDDGIDEMLTALEGQAMPALRKLLLKDYNLSTFERALLAYLIAFQEFRTPWARSNFQKLQLELSEHLFHASANAPGYMERVLQELKAEGESDGSVSADQIRDALKDQRIKLVAQPHAGIDSMVWTSQTIGNVYTQMLWTVLHSREREFLTSDTPVVRRDPGFKGGFYGGGLMSPTAQVWFPLSKSACLVIRHDADKREKFHKLLEAGKVKEAEVLRAKLPPIREAVVQRALVDAVNFQTVVNADRFVYSPYESADILKLFRGESQNFRIAFS
ncbi:MAG TPA: DUF4238 domain-containing protein [Terriglobales bacterium]|jgi:hypothetical protein